MRLPKLLIAILTAGLLAMALGGVASATPDTEQAKLTAADAAAGDQFGFSVSVSGDTAVIGAIGDDDAVFSGSAYVFVRSGGI